MQRLNPEPPPALSMEIVILISKYVSYKDGLAALRQTSKGNYEAVEYSDVGQIARYSYIHHPEPGVINAYFANFINGLYKCKTNIGILNLDSFCTGPSAGATLGAAVYGIPGAIFGGIIGAITSVDSFNDPRFCKDVEYYAGISKMLAIPFTAFTFFSGNYNPTYIAANALSGISNLASMGLFANRNSVEATREEIMRSRINLEKPYEYIPITNRGDRS